MGLHSGQKATVRLAPAPPNTGLAFVRTDMPGAPRIPVAVSSLGERLRQTCLRAGDAEVQTVEHLLAGVRAGAIDNLVMEIDGPEVPAMDGSARDFCEAVAAAGAVEQGIEQKAFVVQEPVSVSDGDVSLVALPYGGGGLRVTYTLSYSNTGTFLDSQYLSLDLDGDAFAREIAPARTFVLESEVEALRKQGLGKGATYENTLVVGKQGVIQNTLRFPNEFVRHKILDLYGDLVALGTAVRGHIIAVKSGHKTNMRFMRRLHEQILMSRGEFSQERANPDVIDIQRVFKALPHRYPFLMVDRILEIVPGKRVTGVKNVSINEPYFQGHYPGHPIMPGVMQIEAMAQVAGFLVTDPETGSKTVPVLMTIDKVKLRKTVIPGDRLVIEAEAVRVRERLAQVSAVARVEGVVVAEAQLKFMVTDRI